MQIAKGKLYLFVGINGTCKFAISQLVDNGSSRQVRRPHAESQTVETRQLAERRRHAYLGTFQQTGI
ncbi:hypothetical protein [Sphingomonas sp. Leaf343]|uniref:hypothetical protein n=1 Tax=Sphingomonas sp. Leaf343 TaxID=1736345 RepID=UPI0006F72DA4|nr:hypothetical protein [Sphingomonas sp. Leaf343]KQR84249.1 hypothetical protein ASG07_06610 [Sphingomonas sp. Leaf343]